MAEDNGAESKKTGNGGTGQRPHTTLDLSAKEIPSDKKPEKQASGQPGTTDDKKPASETKATPSPEKQQTNKTSSPASDDSSGYDMATHISAGLLGGALALVLGYFIYGDRSSGFSAEQQSAIRGEIADSQKRIASLEDGLGQASENTQQLAAASAQTDSLKTENESLKQTVNDLSERLAKLEARPSETGVTEQAVQQSLNPLTGRVAELEQGQNRIAELEQSLGRVADLEQNLSRIAKAQERMQTDGRAAALALALYNLRRATDEGKPYAAELRTISDMSPVSLDLAALEKHQDSGVSSLEKLTADFNNAAIAAIDAENEPVDESLASEIWSRAKSFVRVRRKGDVPGNSTRAILARVENRLEAGNLSAASTEVEQLQGKAAEAIAPWRDELNAKIAADKELAEVESKLLTALSGEETEKRGG